MWLQEEEKDAVYKYPQRYDKYFHKAWLFFQQSVS